jgi:hypothetical protein
MLRNSRRLIFVLLLDRQLEKIRMAMLYKQRKEETKKKKIRKIRRRILSLFCLRSLFFAQMKDEESLFF